MLCTIREAGMKPKHTEEDFNRWYKYQGIAYRDELKLKKVMGKPLLEMSQNELIAVIGFIAVRNNLLKDAIRKLRKLVTLRKK